LSPKGQDCKLKFAPKRAPCDFDSDCIEAIVALAKTRYCDLIVMASHGRRGLRKP
jgi:hypothetical protein